MDETFFAVSFMAVSSEIYKTENKTKFLFNSFLAAKLTFTKNICFPFFYRALRSNSLSICSEISPLTIVNN